MILIRLIIVDLHFYSPTLDLEIVSTLIHTNNCLTELMCLIWGMSAIQPRHFVIVQSTIANSRHNLEGSYNPLQIHVTRSYLIILTWMKFNSMKFSKRSPFGLMRTRASMRSTTRRPSPNQAMTSQRW